MGISLEDSLGIINKLGLIGGKKDANAPGVNEVIDQELVLELRELLKQYDMNRIHGSWTSFLG